MLVSSWTRFRSRISRRYLDIGSGSKTRGQRLSRSGHEVRARWWLKLASAMSWLSLFQVMTRTRRVVIVEAAVIASSLVTAIALSPLALDVAGLVAGIGLLFSASALYMHYRRARSQEDSIVIVPHDHDATLATEMRPVKHDKTLALYDADLSWRLTQACLTGSAKATWNPLRRPLPPQLQEYQDRILLHRYNSTKAIRPFNGLAASQRSDLESSLNDGAPPVEFGPTRYFDMMCSNYLVEYDILTRDRDRVLHGRDLMLDHSGNLLPLSRSHLSNTVGVSTLAFDRDRTLILVAQSEEALSSQGAWAPSGSGSLEPIDFPHRGPSGRRSYPLSDVIVRGMNRELAEEANVDPVLIDWSTVTGYFRWLSKGAKPEYVGITTLSAPAAELRRAARWNERRWVSTIHVGVHVDFDVLKRDPRKPEKALHRNGRDTYPEFMSLPLYIALRALGERLRDPQFEERFLENRPTGASSECQSNRT